jgi:hypothetical protein
MRREAWLRKVEAERALKNDVTDSVSAMANGSLLANAKPHLPVGTVDDAAAFTSAIEWLKALPDVGSSLCNVFRRSS